MLSRVLPGSLRGQLAIAIAAVMALGVGVSFLAVYGATGSRLRAQIDSQLRTQVSEWRQFANHADLSSPAALSRTARVLGRRGRENQVKFAVSGGESLAFGVVVESGSDGVK